MILGLLEDSEVVTPMIPSFIAPKFDELEAPKHAHRLELLVEQKLWNFISNL